MLYTLLIFLYLILYIPKAFYDYIFLNKKKKDFLKRIGIQNYTFNSQNKNPVIWIHAVSLGETKAVIPLLKKLKIENPSSYIIVSNTTQTGHDEAKKSLLLADKLVFFPVDLPFVVKKIFSQIKPNIIIFVETDLWFNFIQEAKKNNAKIIVVSAKISEKSSKRFSKFLFFSKKLFSYVDLVLPQNELYKKRFAAFLPEEKLSICGNLKFVNNTKKYSQDYLQGWKDKLKTNGQFIITIASTHDPEELLIINEIKDISNIKILLAPRHPERFNIVYNQIKKIASCSLLNEFNQDTKIIIIDQMGILNILYQISHLAILGGSYVNKIGGHNILEPVFVNTPVLFGPFMHSQLELNDFVLNSKCGRQIDLKDMKNTISHYVQDDSLRQNLVNSCAKINMNSEIILQNTFDNIKKLILNA